MHGRMCVSVRVGVLPGLSVTCHYLPCKLFGTMPPFIEFPFSHFLCLDNLLLINKPVIVILLGNLQYHLHSQLLELPVYQVFN